MSWTSLERINLHLLLALSPGFRRRRHREGCRWPAPGRPAARLHRRPELLYIKVCGANSRAAYIFRFQRNSGSDTDWRNSTEDTHVQESNDRIELEGKYQY